MWVVSSVSTVDTLVVWMHAAGVVSLAGARIGAARWVPGTLWCGRRAPPARVDRSIWRRALAAKRVYPREQFEQKWRFTIVR